MRIFNRRKQRILAFVFSMFLFCMLMAASVFIVLHADHDCSGGDCPICEDIRQAENTFRVLGSGTDVLAITVPVFSLFFLSVSFLASGRYVIFTLVGQKVQMNN